MADRVNAEGLPLPRPHLGSSEAYLHRACLLLDQVSRQLGELLAQGQAPAVSVTSGSAAQVELVTEPATPKPPAKKAAASRAKKGTGTSAS